MQSFRRIKRPAEASICFPGKRSGPHARKFNTNQLKRGWRSVCQKAPEHTPQSCEARVVQGSRGLEWERPGWSGAWVLGVFLHYFIAFSAAVIYCLASRRLGFLGHPPRDQSPPCDLISVIVRHYSNCTELTIASHSLISPRQPCKSTGLFLQRSHEFLRLSARLAFFGSTIVVSRKLLPTAEVEPC